MADRKAYGYRYQFDNNTNDEDDGYTSGGRGGPSNDRVTRATSAPAPPTKIVLIGDMGVGKSSLIARYVGPSATKQSTAAMSSTPATSTAAASRDPFAVHDPFHANYNPASTIGVEFFAKTVTTSDGESVKVHIWDTAGQERHRSLTRQVFRGTKGAMLVYDVTNRQSFEALPAWLNQLKDEDGNESCSLLLVGNKCDLTGEPLDGDAATADNAKTAKGGDSAATTTYVSAGSGAVHPNDEPPTASAVSASPPTATAASNANGGGGSGTTFVFKSGASGSVAASGSKLPSPANSVKDGGSVPPSPSNSYSPHPAAAASSSHHPQQHQFLSGASGSAAGGGRFSYMNTPITPIRTPNNNDDDAAAATTPAPTPVNNSNMNRSSTLSPPKTSLTGADRASVRLNYKSAAAKARTSMAVSSSPNSVFSKKQREVSKEEAEAFAREHNMTFLETSAKTSTNVERAFRWLVTSLVEAGGHSRNGGGAFTEGNTTRQSVNLSGTDIRRSRTAENMRSRKQQNDSVGESEEGGQAAASSKKSGKCAC